MDISNYTIKLGFGKYNNLDKAYRNLIRQQINSSESWINRWEIYDTVINEIILLEDETIFDEIKYRVTGGENINNILLDIINKKLEYNLMAYSFISKIEGYCDIDWLKEFYL